MKNCIKCGAVNSDPNQKFCNRKCKKAYNDHMGTHGMQTKPRSQRTYFRNPNPDNPKDFAFGVAFDYEGNSI